MVRQTLLLSLAILAAISVSPSPASNHHRGFYHQDLERGFAVWIPAGFTRTPPRSDDAIAYFTGGTNGGYAIEFRKPHESQLDDYVKARLRRINERFPGSDVKVVRDVDAGGRPAVVLVLTALGGDPAFKDAELIEGCIALHPKATLLVTVYARIGTHTAGLEAMRWMLNTLRFLGPKGSPDAYLDNRRVHPSTGLSYRPPRKFRDRSKPEGEVIYAAQHQEADLQLELTRSHAESPGAALIQGTPGDPAEIRTWTLPHPEGFLVVGTFLTSGSRGSARVAFQVKDRKDLQFLVQASGPSTCREQLLRIAELTALATRVVDVAAATLKAEAAMAALKTALARRRDQDVEKHVKELCALAYLDPVVDTLIGVMPRLQNCTLQVTVAQAVSQRDVPQFAGDLLKLAKHSKIKMNPPVLAAVLEALGSARSRKNINFLLSHATRGDNQVSASAIRALGRHGEFRARIVKRLVSLMERHESAAEKRDFTARDRWDVVLPAFQDALENLTDMHFRTADEAAIWLRKNRM